MKLALYQGPGVINSPDAAFALMETKATEARANGARLLLFPKMYLSGHNVGAEDVRRHALTSAGLAPAQKIAQNLGMCLAFGYPERVGDQVANAAVLIDATGTILLNYRNSHLRGERDRAVFGVAGQEFPLATVGGAKLGLLICYDIEFPETARAVASLGAELLIVTDGNMDPFGPVHRRAIVARAMENQIFAVLTNRCGAGADSMTFPGESVLVDPFGEVVATAGAEAARLSARIDLDRLSASRARYRYLDDARVALDLAKTDAAGSRPALVIPEPRRRAG